MADESKNILRVDYSASREDVDDFFSFIASKGEFPNAEADLLIDFQKIIPVEAKEEDLDWRKSRIEKWGTKSCYYFGQERLDDYTIEFLTAWNGVPALIKKLSEKFPHLKLYYVCCLGYERNYSVGTYIFQSGITLKQTLFECGSATYDQHMDNLCAYEHDEPSNNAGNVVVFIGVDALNKTPPDSYIFDFEQKIREKHSISNVKLLFINDSAKLVEQVEAVGTGEYSSWALGKIIMFPEVLRIYQIDPKEIMSKLRKKSAPGSSSYHLIFELISIDMKHISFSRPEFCDTVFIEEDPEYVVGVYKDGVEKGYATSMYRLANCYYYGSLVDRDFEQAVYWYRKAASKGFALAQYHLGDCYYYGEGAEQDYTQAAEWYRKSAEQGYYSAQFSLGQCYSGGYGVEKDYEQAMCWYLKSAEQDYCPAQFYLAIYYYYGEYVVKNLGKAVLWFRKAAEGENDDAQFYLGTCYCNGEGVEQDYVQAVFWFQKAAEHEHFEAQSALGECYYSGKGVEQDYKQAVYWLEKAVEKSSVCVDAHFLLGNCYNLGYGVEQDVEKAFRFYERAAQKGHKIAEKIWKERITGESILIDLL